MPDARAALLSMQAPKRKKSEETLGSELLRKYQDSVKRACSSRNSHERERAYMGKLSDHPNGPWMSSGVVSNGEFWTRSMCEYPAGTTKDENGNEIPVAKIAYLSDVLETENVPEKYYLSPRACAGIIRRAENRGKQLPKVLNDVLYRVAGDLVNSDIDDDEDESEEDE